VRRTRKWAFVAQEAKRLADLGLPPVEIAKRLGAGVNRSTVQRWMAAGKIRDTRLTAKGERLPSFSKETKPEEWAMTVRKEFALSATDEQLVAGGAALLAVWKDPLQPMSIRISAFREFRATAKQLAVSGNPAEAPAAPEKPASVARAVPPRRTGGGDPRNVLMMPAAAGK
jgi:hypothetical protein